MQATNPRLEKIVVDATDRGGSGIGLAIELHNYVRDQIKFGFTPYFDAASPDITLALGVGHCNPQAWLLVELFRVAGFEARFRPATIDNKILKGVASTPPRLSHVFTEVKTQDTWLRIDSYIADSALRDAAVKKLQETKMTCGYGCHKSATGDWDGMHDAYSQIADPDMILQLHEPVQHLKDFFQSDAYTHRIGPLSYNLALVPSRLVAPLAMAVLNRGVNRLRRAGSERVCA